jgi:predicted aminopeptidase
LYGADLTLVQKRQGKEQLFRALKIDYQALIDQRWAGIGWFDGWFKAPLNNARVAAVATYRDRVPEFNALMESCEFDFKRFFVTLEKRTKAGGHFLVPKVCDQAS